ncbi:MAG: hypothetical protein M3Q79_04005 [bacterium]|nr:hypothetical protein [bacterium]
MEILGNQPSRSFRPDGISDEIWEIEREKILQALIDMYIPEQRKRLLAGDAQSAEQLEKVLANSIEGTAIAGADSWLESDERRQGLLTGNFDVIMTEASLRIVSCLTEIMPRDPFYH